MTKQEYDKQSNRVEEYAKIESKIEILEKEKAKINNGIVSILCDYDKTVVILHKDNAFREGIVKCVADYYDSEINRLRIEQEKI